MRQLGTLPGHDEAKRFIDYLRIQGIRTRAEEANDGKWLIWVIREDDFERSQAEYKQFKISPEDGRYRGHEASAEKLRAESRLRALQSKKNFNVVRGTSRPREKLSVQARRIPVTFGLIAICIVVGVSTGLGSNAQQQKQDPLMFVSRQHYNDNAWDPSDPNDAMVDVRAGQLWRVFTPAIVHLSYLHLLFNMFWVHRLGGQIETRKGKVKFIAMVLALAVFSNLVQVFISRHPFFGGMSGVVYGLFGYIWIKSRFDPRDRFQIDQVTVNFMLIWFVICFLPTINVANGGHGGGLALGIVMGFISAKLT